MHAPPAAEPAADASGEELWVICDAVGRAFDGGSCRVYVRADQRSVTFPERGTTGGDDPEQLWQMLVERDGVAHDDERIAVLLRHGDGPPLGLLEIARTGCPPFTAADVTSLRAFAALAAAALDHDASRKKHEAARAASLDRESRLRLAVESASIGVWDFDVGGRTLMLDSLCKRMLGLPARVEIDQDWSQLLERVHLDDRERVRDGITHALDPESSGEYRAEYRRVPGPGGGSPWLSACGRAFFDATGRPQRFLGTLRDVTDRRQVDHERDRLIEELGRTIRFSETFVGILGHDLRNPLGAMVTAAQVALRSTGGGEIARPLERIVSSGRRMGRMIDQLLDFTSARIGTGIPLHRADADLAAVCRTVVDELQTSHPSRPMTLIERGDTRGSWDADRLSQVISNLAGNAIQHGDPAHPIEIVVDGEAADVVELQVVNRGTVPADVVPVLFSPFRGTQHKRDGSRGLGLGLFVTREIVLAHGGDIDVSSSETDGTRFLVRLPRSAPAPRPSDLPSGDRGLERLAEPVGPTAITAQLFGVVPLHERNPADYWQVYRRYLRALDASVQRQIYKDDVAGTSEELRAIAEELGALRAGAREVAEIHSRAVRQKTMGVPAAKVAAVIAEGRLLALELMGHLLSYYRRRAALTTLGRAP